MRSLRLSRWCVVWLSAAGLAQAGLAGSPPAVRVADAPGSAIQLSPTHVNFGAVTIGEGREGILINVVNNGSSDVTIFSIGVTGADRGDFILDPICPSTLPADGVCSITVLFNPTAMGKRTATLDVNDNAPPSPQTVSLAGVGTEVQLSTISLSFGNETVGTTSLPKTVILTNVGKGAMRITSISVTGANAGDFSQTNTCGTSVAAGGSCNITVTFTPSATGSRGATVVISDNGGGSPQNVLLSGNGT